MHTDWLLDRPAAKITTVFLPHQAAPPWLARRLVRARATCMSTSMSGCSRCTADCQFLSCTDRLAQAGQPLCTASHAGTAKVFFLQDFVDGEANMVGNGQSVRCTITSKHVNLYLCGTSANSTCQLLLAVKGRRICPLTIGCS